MLGRNQELPKNILKWRGQCLRPTSAEVDIHIEDEEVERLTNEVEVNTSLFIHFLLLRWFSWQVLIARFFLEEYKPLVTVFESLSVWI